jgi:hypothetical protein
VNGLSQSSYEFSFIVIERLPMRQPTLVQIRNPEFSGIVLTVAASASLPLIEIHMRPRDAELVSAIGTRNTAVVPRARSSVALG